jgi:hypothetical protein
MNRLNKKYDVKAMLLHLFFYKEQHWGAIPPEKHNLHLPLLYVSEWRSLHDWTAYIQTRTGIYLKNEYMVGILLWLYDTERYILT